MRVLTDTHVLIWALIEPHRMPVTHDLVLKDRSNDFFFSAVNIWEIAIKQALGRLDFDLDPIMVLAAARQTGFAELPVRSAAAARVATMPHHHRDPFDRLLVAQAIEEDAHLLSVDPILALYGDHVLVLS